MLLNLPSIRKSEELFSKLHILCQTKDSWFFQRLPWMFSCNFCTSIIATLMAINKSCINRVWTMRFPLLLLGEVEKKNKGMTICSQRLNQNHPLPFPETHIPSTSKRIYGRNELIVWVDQICNLQWTRSTLKGKILKWK